MERLNRNPLSLPRGRFSVFFFYVMLLAMAGTARASLPVTTADPNCFFTTVASRLLASELNLKLSCLPVYPANQYTPAVNRLLQVTANIYDATTTNYYPSVFRPLFWKTNELNSSGLYQTNIYIVGYQYVQEPLTDNGPAIFTPPTDISDPSVPFGLSGISNNIYGFPWIIGVKKGLPNFNAFEMENCFSIARKLQFTRNNIAPVAEGNVFPYGRIYATNQMYIMSISNYLGVEFWNSYASNYNNSVTVVVNDQLSVTMTNDAGSGGTVFPFNTYALPLQMTSATNIITWSGYLHESPDPSFVLPLATNTTWLTNSVYFYGNGTGYGVGFSANSFIPAWMDPSNFLDAGTPPLPNFGLLITNRLQAFIIDRNDCILDYVQLGGMDSSLNVNEAIADNSQGYTTGLWSTNFFNVTTTPLGVVEQFLVSLVGGALPAEDNDGGSWSQLVPGTTTPSGQQAFFSAFFSASDVAYDGRDGIMVSNFDYAILAPYTPRRLAVQRIVYAANDPLVHYQTSDLQDVSDDTNSRVLDVPPLGHLSTISDRYMPWGTAGNLAAMTFDGILPDNNAYNLAYKDPWVFAADDWDFPTNQTLSAAWLGQVHRGTPWQTIFLKSTNIVQLTGTGGFPFTTGLDTWQLWTGDLDATDALAMAPAQDWQMAGTLASLFSTNYGALFSVNSSPAAWESLFNGLTVVSNDRPNMAIQIIPQLQFVTFVIASNSPQAAVMANAIQGLRAQQPGQWFTNVGDIFEVAQLSTASPYLNTNLVQVRHGLNDEAYEAIPQQLLPLLRVDSIGSIVPANGQSLIHFTGDDNHAYALQVSPDLVNWTSVSTNRPVNGTFTITNPATAGREFYRTVFVR